MGITLEAVDMRPQVQGLQEVHPGACGYVTLGAGSGCLDHPGDCGHVSPSVGFWMSHPGDCG